MPIIAMPSTIADAASVVDWDATPTGVGPAITRADGGAMPVIAVPVPDAGGLSAVDWDATLPMPGPHTSGGAVTPIIVCSQAGPGSTFLFAS